ncbi:permease [Vibrio sp. Of14-4]|uniref:permease n=1 Tax=Vibrio sp. Of14-4 TaxID=2724878 RepID=UPI001EF3B14D|nr:permease [Vibrio sp. Of14-4]MCG7489506.1 permease [Vibrio sp. Of14-4]
MEILLPFVYLIFGILVGKKQLKVKTFSSFVLTKMVIPLIIIWNISLNSEEMVLVIVLAMIFMLSIFFFRHWMERDVINNLCFCYLNIGWLGLPIAHALLGDTAARFVLGAYIGSSIVGNSIGANYLKKEVFSIKNILTSPPVIAFIIGCLLIPFERSVEVFGHHIYMISKFLMSFLGMMILGIWLSETSLDKSDFFVYAKSYAFRILMLSTIVLIAFVISQILNSEFVYQQLPWLFLICVLPPAANIIVLETSYLGTGMTASKISVETILSIAVIVVYGIVIHSLSL